MEDLIGNQYEFFLYGFRLCRPDKLFFSYPDPDGGEWTLVPEISLPNISGNANVQ
jgi:hypothetical protein